MSITKIVWLLVVSLAALWPVSPCVARQQPATSTPRDIANEARDRRVSWESPYFLVRKVPGTDYWAFVFTGIGGGDRFPFLLIESSSDSSAIIVESPKKDFRVQLLANRAVVTFPGTGKRLQRGKGEYGGLWYVDGVALKPIARTWHPKGSNALTGQVCIPRSLGSEELQRQLEEPGIIESILVGESSAEATELSIADLPKGEREVALADLAVANAPRWILKVCGKPLKVGAETWLYSEDPGFSKELIGLLPPEWHKFREVARKNSVYEFMAGKVKGSIGPSKVALGAANTALQKHPILKKPLEELDVEGFAQLSQTVFTTLPDRLTKAALGIIGGNGGNPKVASLDQAIKNGNATEVVLAWADFSEVERDAFVALSTQTLFGRVRCPQSRLTHIDLLSKACEVASEAGPAVIKELATEHKHVNDDLLRQQCVALTQSGPKTVENLVNVAEPQHTSATRDVAATAAVQKRLAGTLARPKDGVQHPDLDKAWAEYEQTIAKVAEKIKAAISKQFDAATAKGDLDAAERWQAALEKFEKAGEVPADAAITAAVSAAVSDYKKAKDELAKVYEAVVKALTMEKKIAEARMVNNEFNAIDAETRNEYEDDF